MRNECIPDRDLIRLRHMLDAARRALELSKGVEVESLDPDDQLALALIRLLEIVGEAARQITLITREAHPEIPWALIGGMRNRLIHEYFDVDYEIVAAVIRDDLPSLVQFIENMVV